jgi:hypothetical protein
MVVQIYEAVMEHKNSRNYSGTELVPVYSYVGIGLSHETGIRGKNSRIQHREYRDLRREFCSSAKIITAIMSTRMIKERHEDCMGDMINA